MTTTSSERDSRSKVLIGAGSNLGDRLSWLRFARRRIAGLPGTRIVAQSHVYETAPVGGPPQGPYLNACLAIETTLDPGELSSAIHAIESDAGRVRRERDAPRTLDLDVLLIGERELAAGGLVVPHPRFRDRAFALLPAADVAADWRIPPGRATVGALAAAVSADGVTRVADPDSWL